MTTPHRYCVTQEALREVVELDPPLPDTMEALVQKLNEKLIHIFIRPTDLLWTKDPEFDCDVVMNQVTQGRKIEVRQKNQQKSPLQHVDSPFANSHPSAPQHVVTPMERSFTRERTAPGIESLSVKDSSGTPLRIFLVRHGESMANIDRTIYETVPDHAVELTRRGHRMAYEAGAFLRRFLKSMFNTKAEVDHHIRMYVSSFVRTRQTAEGLLRALNDSREQWVDDVRESTLLVEQDWGAQEGEGKLADSKYQEEMARIRIKGDYQGKFYARLPNGESCFDVCQRVSGLIPDIMHGRNVATSERRVVRTVIIVSHGVTCRAFLAMWTRLSPEWFHQSKNPPNCSVQMLEEQHHRGYIFGGYEESKNGTSCEADDLVPHNVNNLQPVEDPQHARWKSFLHEVAGNTNDIA